MLNEVPRVLLFTLIPVVAATLGGVISVWRSPGSQLRSIVQHFAAGVVFAAAAGELLPEVVHEKSVWAVVIGGGLGIIAMLTVKQFAEKAEGSLGLITTAGVDVLIDGLIIGIGFAAGSKAGILLTIALTIELLFLSLSVAATLSRDRTSPGKVIATTVGIALLLPLGAIAGFILLGGLSGNLLAGFLAFGLVALLYLVTEELLTEAHEVPDTPFTSAMFFVGFLLLIVIEETLQ